VGNRENANFCDYFELAKGTTEEKDSAEPPSDPFSDLFKK
jgi:hypothetical protein